MNGPRVTPFKPTARERLDDYLADQRSVQTRNKETMMKRRKTAQGDMVARFPDLADRATRVAEVRRELNDAFVEAEQAAALKARMAAVKAADSTRFPVLGGEA